MKVNEIETLTEDQAKKYLAHLKACQRESVITKRMWTAHKTRQKRRDAMEKAGVECVGYGSHGKWAYIPTSVFLAPNVAPMANVWNNGGEVKLFAVIGKLQIAES
jgi:hypothetical protein